MARVERDAYLHRRRRPVPPRARRDAGWGGGLAPDPRPGRWLPGHGVAIRTDLDGSVPGSSRLALDVAGLRVRESAHRAATRRYRGRRAALADAPAHRRGRVELHAGVAGGAGRRNRGARHRRRRDRRVGPRRTLVPGPRGPGRLGSRRPPLANASSRNRLLRLLRIRCCTPETQPAAGGWRGARSRRC